MNEIRFTRSVSEYTRQMEEQMNTSNPKPEGIETYHQACEAVRTLRKQCCDPTATKSTKAANLARLRSLENFWGLPSTDYNSTAFQNNA